MLSFGPGTIVSLVRWTALALTTNSTAGGDSPSTELIIGVIAGEELTIRRIVRQIGFRQITTRYPGNKTSTAKSCFENECRVWPTRVAFRRILDVQTRISQLVIRPFCSNAPLINMPYNLAVQFLLFSGIRTVKLKRQHWIAMGGRVAGKVGFSNGNYQSGGNFYSSQNSNSNTAQSSCIFWNKHNGWVRKYKVFMFNWY